MSKKSTQIYACKICDFSSSKKNDYDRHMMTRKHKILTCDLQKSLPKKLKKTPNAKNIFVCKECDYTTSRNQDYIKHINTRKHKILTGELKETLKFECECGKRYKHRQTLHAHKKKCTFNITTIEIKEETPQINDVIEMMKKLMTENEKLTELVKKMPKEMPPGLNLTNNNNNQYYINIFLNEICKDALNINDFVKSLMIGVDELELAKAKGLTEGVSSILVDGLNKLEVSQRPIHCTNLKKKTLYIKNDDKWDKDNKEVLDDTINDVKRRHHAALIKWQEDHPGWETDEKLTMEFLGMLKSINMVMDKNNINKITKQISNETIIEPTEIKEIVTENE